MKSIQPLRRWLTLQTALVSAVPLIAVAALLWLVLLPQMRTEIAASQQALARAIAGRVEAHLLGAELELQALANYIQSQDQKPPVFWFDLLDAHAGKGEAYEAIYVTDSNQRVHAVGLPQMRRGRREDLIGLELSHREFLREALAEKKAVWSETFLSTVTSRLAVALAIPLSDRAIIGEITLEQLSEFIGYLPMESGMFTMIIDRQGRVIADSSGRLGGQQSGIIMRSTFRDNLAERLETSQFEMEGGLFVGTRVTVGQVGWKVLVAQPYPDAFRLITSTMRVVGAGLAIALLLAVVAGWLQARGFSRHFARYTRQARAIADGDYDQPWPNSTILEFDDLAANLQRMSNAIRERENKLRTTLDSIGDAVIATDINGVITRINPVAQQLTGWNVREALGMPLAKVFHIINAQTRENVDSPVEKVLARGDVVGLANHTTLIARDGREYQIADSGAPIRRADGQIMGVVLVFRDVTEVYEQAQRIRESEELLKNITTNLPAVVYRFHAYKNHAYTNTFVSEQAADVFDLSAHPAEFFSAFTSCIPEDDKVRFLASIEDAVEKIAPWHYEGRFLKPSGEEIWFYGSSIPHQESDHVVFDGVLMDITDRKRAEIELQRLRNYLLNVIDSMPSVLVGVDADGRVTQWNQNAASTTGMEVDDALGQPLEAVYPPLHSKMDKIKETIRTGQIHTEQKVPRQDNGEIRYEDLIIYPLITNGAEGAVIRVDDVSERVRLEEMMIQSEKMISVGRLAAGMAHEINNPLAGILQNAMVLENRLCGDMEANHRAAQAAGISMAAIRAYLEERGLMGLMSNIRESGTRAAKIVRNMLEFARKGDRVFSSHDLGQLLDRTVELAASDYNLRKDYDFKKIQIVREYAANLQKVPCEKSKIQQVVLNILRNGAEAMASRETSDGGPPRFVLRTRLDGDMARIEIEDNGPGMPEATSKRIFEPFFTTKSVNRGTGLGLSVSYFIVTEDHKGTLSVSSLEGKGTIFIIRLPLAGRERQ